MKENLYEAISRFIDQVSAKLPYEPEQIGTEFTYIFGFELKLTGVKHFDGEPLEDGRVYKVQVPIYKGKMEGDRPTVKHTDHRQQLRLMYLKNGLPGIYNYLGKYMSREDVDLVKKTFMHLSKCHSNTTSPTSL